MRGGKEEGGGGERKKGVAWRGSSTHSSTPVRKASRAGGTCSQNHLRPSEAWPFPLEARCSQPVESTLTLFTH